MADDTPADEMPSDETAADASAASASAVNERSDDGTEQSADALLSRLRLIEQQPLEQRAEAFSRVHEELHAALEGADAPRN
jgi:exo-beta-1,3-glucanase (GH17 family)